MEKGKTKIIKLGNYVSRYYLKTVFIVVGISLSILAISSYLVFQVLSNSITGSILRTVSSIFSNINEKTKLIAYRYNEKFIQTIDLVEKLIEKGDKNAVSDFLSQELKMNYEQDFTRINYYIISRDGTIIETDYETDTGLNLSIYETFWKLLNKELDQSKYYVQSVGSELKTGSRRIFVYKKMTNGQILELGFAINPDLFENDFRIVKSISTFVEQVSILFNGIPISPIFETASNKKASGFSYSRLYKKEHLMTYSIIDGLISQNFEIYVRTNFRGIFLVIELITVVGTLIVVSILFFNAKLSKTLAKEIDKIEEAINEYGNTGFYNTHRESFIEEVNDTLIAFSNLSEIITANVQEINASNQELEASYKEIQKLSLEIKEAFHDFSLRLSYIVEGFEEGTGKHLHRVKFIVEKLCDKLVGDAYLKEDIIYFSSLHDIGKVFIPQEILNKPGPLTPEEWEEIKKHTIYAERILSHPRFKVALNIAKYHHENYDGTGYPFGLKGEDIPLEERIVKIADVYDALVSNRPYKHPYNKAEALRIIFEGDGRVNPEHFDPKVLQAFKEIIDYL
ncbi:MAG: HD domain-containing protein [Fervidobacterium sp.]|nr:HD domain-containing protein [Fervidobacterium sp.]